MVHNNRNALAAVVSDEGRPTSKESIVRNLSPLSLGERYDEVGARMDAAYAALRGLTHGTPEHVAATALLEGVYVDLRALNTEAATAKEVTLMRVYTGLPESGTDDDLNLG